MEYEIDLHGLRPSDALQMLGRHVETNYAAGSPWIHVIHGRGAGKLRTAVRDSLDANRLVRRYYFAPPAQGGDGMTIAELRRGHKRPAHKRPA